VVDGAERSQLGAEVRTRIHDSILFLVRTLSAIARGRKAAVGKAIGAPDALMEEFIETPSDDPRYLFGVEFERRLLYCLDVQDRTSRSTTSAPHGQSGAFSASRRSNKKFGKSSHTQPASKPNQPSKN
jgi:hypothetical protein